jgi:hypothetical protein
LAEKMFNSKKRQDESISISGIINNVQKTGCLTIEDHHFLMSATFDHSLDTVTRQCVHGLLHSVHRGRITLVKKSEAIA